MLYNEDVSGNTTLNLYDQKGFINDDGQTSHTAPLQLATLPEKCVWSANAVRVFCSAFAVTSRNQIPDDWYQGSVALQDTFWTINTDTSELVYLADPQKEIGHSFDVISPFLGRDEDHLFFVDKNDFTLWSMRLQKEKYQTQEEADPSSSAPHVLSPDEFKDAAGSTGSTSVPVSKKVVPKTK